jgi:hypothetical protein
MSDYVKRLVRLLLLYVVVGSIGAVILYLLEAK